MDTELKEYIEQSEYYNDIDIDNLSDRDKEAIRDTTDFAFWKCRKAFRDLGYAVWDAKWIVLLFAGISYLTISLIIELVS